MSVSLQKSSLLHHKAANVPHKGKSYFECACEAGADGKLCAYLVYLQFQNESPQSFGDGVGF